MFRTASFQASSLLLLILLTVLVLPAAAQTPYVPPEAADLDAPSSTGPATGGGEVEWPAGRINYLFELDQIAAFLDVWQYLGADSDFGGMIEAEGGPLGDVIQTDNTLEAIWVWSRYTELTGSVEYLDNIADAWVYVGVHPPWLEEGGNGYYRVHNAAWGLTAESAYRSATGDDGFLAFAETCADYIVSVNLFLNQFQKLNAFVQGWAAGNLYLYGEEMSDAGWMTAALAQGEELIDWVEFDPPVQLALETWAMSSGTLVWGICNSVFRDDPARGGLWIDDYGALVDTFQVWYDNAGDSFDWDNSWNVGYVNGQFAMGDVSGDAAYTRNGENLTRLLLSYDTDDDGGIQGTTQDPVTEDMTWVTTYLAKFGVARILGQPPQTDAGLLQFTSPADGDIIVLPAAGAPVPIRVLATNFGLQDIPSVDVHLAGDASGLVTIALDFVEKEEVELDAGWTPPGPGDYELIAYTTLAGDEDALNDTLRIMVKALDAASAGGEGPSVLSAGSVRPNPSSGVSWIALDLPEGTPAEIGIFTPDGRRVTAWSLPAGERRRVERAWRGATPDGERLPAGIYFLRARIGGGLERHLKIVRLDR